MLKEIKIGSENFYKIWIMWFYVSWVEYIQSCTFITNLLALKWIMEILCTFIHQFWKALKTKPIITLALITTQASLKKLQHSVTQTVKLRVLDALHDLLGGDILLWFQPGEELQHPFCVSWKSNSSSFSFFF